MNKLLELLNELDFPTTQRKNVLRGKQKGYHGFVLGTVNARGLGKMTSRKTKMPKYADLYAEAKRVMRKRDPKFKFTSIQFNKNHRTAKHKDANNVGSSYIVGLGDYSGGDLVVYDEKGGNPKSLNIKNRFYKFNGSILPHETAPFKGNRYTLVFYAI